MRFANWNVTPHTVFTRSSVIPVLVINDIKKILPLAKALMAGGVKTLEITLRTPQALQAIQLLHRELQGEMTIGAGTVINPHQLQQVIEAGAEFAISPGSTPALLAAGAEAGIPFIPGISSISELMMALEMDYRYFKFFPAEAVGGVAMLKAIYGPLPQPIFCPTGGINATNYLDYLALPNVQCVGGSWIVPEDAIEQNDWQRITNLCLHLAKPKG